jgi:multidrug efflux pump subunit AcrA (membrane-fusion protein)
VTPVLNGTLVTYPVRLTLDPTDAAVRVGMSATANVVVNQLEDVITVPSRFIRIDRASQQAFATIQREDGQFEEVPVELGVRNDSSIQIVGGLTEGQRIVILPRDSFNPFEN